MPNARIQSEYSYRHRSVVAIGLGVVSGFGTVPIARAQVVSGGWTVTRLQPMGSSSSAAYGASGPVQVGGMIVGGLRRAVVWTGSAATWGSLGPADAFDSEAFGAAGGQQVGYSSRTGETAHAALWSGSASSWVDLHPAGANMSFAYGSDGLRQVGWALFGNSSHASVWNGTAESWVDLHPVGASASLAYAGFGGTQVGVTNFGQVIHASLWSGSTESWVDLNPSASSQSGAYGVFGTQQVGHVDGRAGLWNGTPSSWVDLDPSVSVGGSYAVATCGTHQAGYAMIGGISHASVWGGTAGSWEDLSLVLAGSWTDTAARGITSDGITITVVGTGFNATLRRTEAILWTRPICAGDFNRSGGLEMQDIFDFVNFWFVGDPRANFNGNELSVQDIFDFLNAWFAGC